MKKFLRNDGRGPLDLRKITIERNFLKHPAGSVLIKAGETKVICTATYEEKVPAFRKGIGGWVTAEYGMLPASVPERHRREASRGRVEGRTQEIQRLVGRVLRSVVDLKALGERTIWIDTDVIQADGGTRTTAINGAIIALADALNFLKKKNLIKKNPLKELIAAISVGIIDGQVYLDLAYNEDVKAEVDLNLAMTESGRIVEIQGTAEGRPFTFDKLSELLAAAKKGISQIIGYQKKLL